MLSLSELLPESARLSLEDSAEPLMLTTVSDRCFTGRLAFDGWLLSSPLSRGRHVGDLYPKRLVEQGPSSSQVGGGQLALLFLQLRFHMVAGWPIHRATSAASASPLIRWVRAASGLPAVPHAALPRGLQCKDHSNADGTVNFRLRVVPMGWAWAVWFIQNGIEHVLDSFVGLTTGGRQRGAQGDDGAATLFWGLSCPQMGRIGAPRRACIWRVALALRSLASSRVPQFGERICRVWEAVFAHSCSLRPDVGTRQAECDPVFVANSREPRLCSLSGQPSWTGRRCPCWFPSGAARSTLWLELSIVFLSVASEVNSKLLADRVLRSSQTLDLWILTSPPSLTFRCLVWDTSSGFLKFPRRYTRLMPGELSQPRRKEHTLPHKCELGVGTARSRHTLRRRMDAAI